MRRVCACQRQCHVGGGRRVSSTPAPASILPIEHHHRKFRRAAWSQRGPPARRHPAEGLCDACGAGMTRYHTPIEREGHGAAERRGIRCKEAMTGRRGGVGIDHGHLWLLGAARNSPQESAAAQENWQGWHHYQKQKRNGTSSSSTRTRTTSDRPNMHRAQIQPPAHRGRSANPKAHRSRMLCNISRRSTHPALQPTRRGHPSTIKARRRSPSTWRI